MPDRLLSAAACAEIAARAAEADQRHELVVCISLTGLQGLLATVAALREAVKPFAQVGGLHEQIVMEVPEHRGRCAACRAAAVYEETK